MKRAYYPERLDIKVRRGWVARVHRAAERADVSPSDWLRRAVARSLESSERGERAERARTASGAAR